jgi:hypothetical protein
METGVPAEDGRAAGILQENPLTRQYAVPVIKAFAKLVVVDARRCAWN